MWDRLFELATFGEDTEILIGTVYLLWAGTAFNDSTQARQICEMLRPPA